MKQSNLTVFVQLHHRRSAPKVESPKWCLIALIDICIQQLQALILQVIPPQSPHLFSDSIFLPFLFLLPQINSQTPTQVSGDY